MERVGEHILLVVFHLMREDFNQTLRSSRLVLRGPELFRQVVDPIDLRVVYKDSSG